MATGWLRTWAGGRVRAAVGGGERFYIQRRLGDGVRVSIALDVASEAEANAEFALWSRDPAGYTTRKQHAVGVAMKGPGVRVDPTTCKEFMNHAWARHARGELTSEYIKQTYAPYLGAWSRAIGGKPLRKVSLDELKGWLKRWETATHARVVALKAFTAWAREEKDAPKLHRSEDPTVDLKTPAVVPERNKRAKGYPVPFVEDLYASLPSQVARDTIRLRACANGVHGTEIGRIARGQADLRRVSDPSGIEGVIVFDHLKKGRPHAVSVDGATFAAALRMQARGSPLSRRAMKQAIDRASIRKHGCGGITTVRKNKRGEKVWETKPCPKCTRVRPGELRHSFATWAVTIGEEVRPAKQSGVDLAKVSEAMGHLGKRTTSYFYVGDRVPNMIRIPISLEHPEDPVSVTAGKQARRQAH